MLDGDALACGDDEPPNAAAREENYVIDSGIASQLAPLLRHLAHECEKLAGSSGNALAILREPEAECRQRADMREKALLMTSDDVAQALNINPRTVRRLWRAGELPGAIQVGKANRWRRHDIDRYIEEKRAR
jgi:excisionase family DNA binding protein